MISWPLVFKEAVVFLALLRLGFLVIYWQDKLYVCRGRRVIILARQDPLKAHFVKFFFDQYFATLIFYPRGLFKTLDFSGLKRQAYLKDGVDFDCPGLPEEAWEVDEYLRRVLLKKGQIVFDGGAFVGYTAYRFAKLVGKKGRVYAFEPDQESHQFLVKNVRRHHWTNIKPIHWGLWSENTKLEFAQDASLSSGVVGVAGVEVGSTKKVRVVSLESACRLLKIKYPHLVKLDIEGAELEVIEGSLEFIKKHPIQFIISCHEREEGGMRFNTADRLRPIFRKINYRTRLSKARFGNYEYQTLFARPA